MCLIMPKSIFAMRRRHEESPIFPLTVQAVRCEPFVIAVSLHTSAHSLNREGDLWYNCSKSTGDKDGLSCGSWVGK